MTETGPSDKFAQDFVDFLNEAVTAHHAVEASRVRLVAAGYVELFESSAASWQLERNGRYFFTRNGTTIIAFAVGGAYKAGDGFTVLGAHTDSPCFKVKPVTCMIKGDALMVNTQPYGGGLWHTWFDRDLGLAGRLLLKNPTTGHLDSKLVRIDKPVARIPNLAIHLAASRDSFAPNIQEEGKAILSMSPSLVATKPESVFEREVGSRLHPVLLHMCAKAAGVDPASIEDMELQLTDVQPSTTGGADDELLFSGRLDNLCSSYQCLRALIDNCKTQEDLSSLGTVNMTLLFDHEECGSASSQGAGSNMFMDTISIITSKLSGDSSTGMLLQVMRASFLCSVDMAHAQHPNYSGKHDATMAPKINSGLVVKHNANQRYATNGLSASVFRRAGKLAGVPVQEFSVRSDSACGSTIGPIISTLSGILTVDCGSPQFSMHSIRECMGKHDAYNGYAHLKAILRHHRDLVAPQDSR